MRRSIHLIVPITLLSMLLLQTVLAAPEPRTTFATLHERYDRPVAEQRADRSWTWGPAPISEPISEAFKTDDNPYPDPNNTSS